MYNLNDCLDTMLDVQHFLDNYSDVVDEADGGPVPNTAMRLHEEVEHVYKALLKLKHEGVK